jgi:hypothetical protein
MILNMTNAVRNVISHGLVPLTLNGLLGLRASYSAFFSDQNLTYLLLIHIKYHNLILNVVGPCLANMAFCARSLASMRRQWGFLGRLYKVVRAKPLWEAWDGFCRGTGRRLVQETGRA